MDSCRIIILIIRYTTCLVLYPFKPKPAHMLKGAYKSYIEVRRQIFKKKMTFV
jgi:hypothetical protein